MTGLRVAAIDATVRQRPKVVYRQTEMEYRRTDNTPGLERELDALKALPRPVFGHASALPNHAIGRAHRHPWAQLSYAIEGVVEVTTAAGRFVAPPLFAVWIPAGVSHGVRCAQQTTIRSLYIEPRALPQARQSCQVIVVTPLLRELIREFSEAPVEYDENGATGRLVRVLLDQLVSAPDAGMMLPWPQDARLRAVCRDMQACVDRCKTLTEYAQALGLSERTLSRLFLRQTGLSFRQWRQRLRLLEALPLLERGERVTDVAIACGYDSMSAFVAAFREQLGITPGDFTGMARRTG